MLRFNHILTIFFVLHIKFMYASITPIIKLKTCLQTILCVIDKYTEYNNTKKLKRMQIAEFTIKGTYD